MFATIMVQNLHNKVVSENFPVFGNVVLDKKEKKRIPTPVALVWAQAERNGGKPVVKILGDAELAEPTEPEATE